MSACGSLVLQSPYEQINGSIRTDLLTAALVYTNVMPYTKARQFTPRKQMSGSTYVAYKKAQVLAGSQNGQRPPQTVIITELQAIGCR
jgi:hypothetical protein